MSNYVYQPYPKHLHKPDGSYKVVENDAERDAALAEGWNLKPGPGVSAEEVAVPESPSEVAIVAEPEIQLRVEPKKRGPGRPPKKKG
jgi:hypothetical protein